MLGEPTAKIKSNKQDLKTTLESLRNIDRVATVDVSKHSFRENMKCSSWRPASLTLVSDYFYFGYFTFCFSGAKPPYCSLFNILALPLEFRKLPS